MFDFEFLGDYIFPRNFYLEDYAMKIPNYIYEIEFGSASPLFEGMGGYIGSITNNTPEYSEIISPKELKDSATIVQHLSEVDWSFTADDTGFLTHDLHPYPAKYIPQIPGHLISRLSLRGELVCDPFGGSGTTALEAVRLGRRAISVDANPVGTLIGKVKTCKLDRKVATDLHAIRCALATRIDDLPRDPNVLCGEYKTFIPDISNAEKWFPLTSRGELALVKARIKALESETAKNIAELALSRIILKVSFQDSETRYSSKPRDIPVGETLKRFLLALDEIVRNVTRTQPALRYGICDFITADIRNLTSLKEESVDLVVTSPPYGNSMDYHLYHRFRLLWLGFDPRNLAKMEIGSHLRHQKEATGFEGYLADMSESLRSIFRVLKPGRYAVLVVGDAIYKEVLYKGAESIGDLAEKIGFESLCIIERQIHKTKRSFISAGRRATTEKLLILKKSPKQIKVSLQPPPYKLWPYEKMIRQREIQQVLGESTNGISENVCSIVVNPYVATWARKLVFTHSIGYSETRREPTWQAIIENGLALQSTSRKDPKYVTHGLHGYKGKFYPQLAKGLINLSGLENGSCILDPFCGSGTTLLEGYLNGHRAHGCDMNPLAAKIARAKVGILDVNPDVLRETVGTLLKKMEQAPAPNRPNGDRNQFSENALDEIEKWFPPPVVAKLNWMLGTIRGVSDGVICDFLEVVLSSIIRDISHQDPNDLRIRRRKIPFKDADVFSFFWDKLENQYERIEKFWSVRGYSPNKFHPAKVREGDSRKWESFKEMGISGGTVDLILTSPPYATALPYIDTDRLSLLVLFGLESTQRRPVEQNLVGSREITTGERKRLEELLNSNRDGLPEVATNYLIDLHRKVSTTEVGFRRKNMPALLLRFFQDMNAILGHCYRALKNGGQAMIVIGDNKIEIDGIYERIPTTVFVEEIALRCGFTSLERIDISVTTENLVHIKNAITENVVLRLKRP